MERHRELVIIGDEMRAMKGAKKNNPEKLDGERFFFLQAVKHYEEKV